MRCESEFVSDLEVRADEALRTTQAIGKSLTRELDRLARRTKQKTVRRSPVSTLGPSRTLRLGAKPSHTRSRHKNAPINRTHNKKPATA